MIDTIVIYQFTDPIYKQKELPHCPRCGSSDINEFKDSKKRIWKAKCKVCDWIAELEKFER